MKDQKMNINFIKWVEENNKIQNLCEEMKNNLLEYLKENVLNTKENCEKNILNNWIKTLGNCDNLDFEDESEINTYVIEHFLDRYQRMLLTLYQMFYQKMLPTKRYIYILDIGAGPANNLFAICDFYKLIREFGNEFNIENFKNINLIVDYVEKSNSFRAWVHKFQEFLFQKEKYYEVPFHNGSFENFNNISYTISSPFYYKNFHFDFIVSSNFFTKANMQNQNNELNIIYKKEIANTIHKLNLNGYFIIISSLNYTFYPELKKYLKKIKTYRSKNIYKLIEILDLNSFLFKKEIIKVRKDINLNLENYFNLIIEILKNYKLDFEPIKKYIKGNIPEWKIIVMKNI